MARKLIIDNHEVAKGWLTSLYTLFSIALANTTEHRWYVKEAEVLHGLNINFKIRGCGHKIGGYDHENIGEERTIRLKGYDDFHLTLEELHGTHVLVANEFTDAIQELLLSMWKPTLKLRVSHFPQVGSNAGCFKHPVSDWDDGQRVASLLADYDMFQFNNKIKPDYCNATVIEYFDPIDNDWKSVDSKDDFLSMCEEIEAELKALVSK